MRLYEIYISEFNTTTSQIKNDLNNIIRNSYDIYDVAFAECKRDFYKQRGIKFSQITDPDEEYHLIERFTREYFRPQDKKTESFDKAFQKAKDNIIEAYIGHDYLAKVRVFLNQTDEQIIIKISHYQAYHQPDEVLFKDIIIDENRLNYTELYNDLINIYIEKVSLIDFVEVMKYKKLPNGKDKIHWKEYKADGIRFADHFKFTIKQLNECFYHLSGKFKANNKSVTEAAIEFRSILQKYKV